MPKESITGISSLPKPTAMTAPTVLTSRASAQRPLLGAMVLSAALHAALLGGVFFTSATPAPYGMSTALEIALQHNATNPVRHIENSTVPADPPDTAQARERELPAPPNPIPAVPEPPEMLARTPVIMSTAESDHRVEMTGDFADLGSITVVEPWQPDRNALAWQEEESAMLLDRVAGWLENPEQLLNNENPIQWEHNGNQYQASVTQKTAESATDLDRTIVEISTDRAGQQVYSLVHLQRLPFSHYAQFINHWDPDVFFSQDSVTGRFHSNTAINISTERDAAPQFQGHVSIATSLSRARSLLASGIFAGGLETRVGRIALPALAMPLSDTETSSNPSEAEYPGLHHFDRDSWISFHASGEYSWRHSADGPEEGRRSTTENTIYLLGNEGVSLSVEGQVSGQIIVYSPRRISITGHLHYVNDPQISSDSLDLLSLISDHTVQIATQNITGSGDLHVQAAIYAARRFSVRQFRTRNNGVLHIYGSVVAGSMSATEPRYATHIEFDQRLESLRAPGFPMTDRYSVESQDHHWRTATR